MATSTEILPGTIVEYANKSRFYIAVALKMENDEKLRLLDEDALEVDIPKKQLTLILNHQINIDTPISNIVNTITQLKSQADYLATQCDPEQLWKLLAADTDTPKKISITEAAEFFFHKPGNEQCLATLRAMRNDGIYFKPSPPHAFLTRTDKQVKSRLIQQQAERDRQNLKTKFVNAALPKLKNNQLPVPELLYTDQYLNFVIETITKFAVFGDAHPAKKDAEYYINKCQELLPTGFHGHSPHLKARDFLKKLGIWDAFTNPELLRYGIKPEFEPEILEDSNRFISA